MEINTPYKVLLVDDEISITESISIYLSDSSCGLDIEVETANNGKEGLEKFSSFNPEVVLLDVNMPIMNGLEVSKRIKKDYRSNSKVLFLSSATEIKDRLKGYEQFADDYIGKPFSIEELTAKGLY